MSSVILFVYFIILVNGNIDSRTERIANQTSLIPHSNLQHAHCQVENNKKIKKNKKNVFEQPPTYTLLKRKKINENNKKNEKKMKKKNEKN